MVLGNFTTVNRHREIKKVATTAPFRPLGQGVISSWTMGFCSFKSPNHCGIHEIQERFRFVIPISIRVSVILTFSRRWQGLFCQDKADFLDVGDLDEFPEDQSDQASQTAPGETTAAIMGNYRRITTAAGLRFDLCVNRATFFHVFLLRLP